MQRFGALARQRFAISRERSELQSDAFHNMVKTIFEPKWVKLIHCIPIVVTRDTLQLIEHPVCL